MNVTIMAYLPTVLILHSGLWVTLTRQSHDMEHKRGCVSASHDQEWTFFLCFLKCSWAVPGAGLKCPNIPELSVEKYVTGAL